MSVKPVDSTCGAIVKLLEKMSVTICYCSTLGDCMLFEDGPGRDSTTSDVRSCPKRTDSSFE